MSAEKNVVNAGIDGVRSAVGFSARPPSSSVVRPSITKTGVAASAKISNPSASLDEVNIPEVEDLRGEFTYNYYAQDERINPAVTKLKSGREIPIDKVSRYVTVRWTPPSLSEFEKSKSFASNWKAAEDTIRANSQKIVSEDNFFNQGYITHTFSDVDAITQGINDLENYGRLKSPNTESVYKMAENLTARSINALGEINQYVHQKSQLAEIAESYMTLADFPSTMLGLKVIDPTKKVIRDEGFFESISKSLTLNMKINSSIVPDIFENSKVKTVTNYFDNLSKAYGIFKTGRLAWSEKLTLPVISQPTDMKQYYTQPVDLLGYVIDRFKYSSSDSSFVKEKSFYIEDITQSKFIDASVLYGHSYFYSVKVVASVRLLSYDDESEEVSEMSEVYVSSRYKSIAVETFEYSPPPTPNDIKFHFDYKERNLIITWDTPVNPQRDIKQFQVFRRKTLEEPFELIAQYHFDKTYPGSDDKMYTTGEVVDGNKSDMNLDYSYLLKRSDFPIYTHRDTDFTVDEEFFESSQFIYAICSVDAHGMISNYSSQFRVRFNSFRNRLSVDLVSDAGAPRQYPNMFLKQDAFADVFELEGSRATQMNVYLTPDHMKVKDSQGRVFPVVQAQLYNENTSLVPFSSTTFPPINNSKRSLNSYYLMQIINLDNQKMQLLRINIKDPLNLTS